MTKPTTPPTEPVVTPVPSHMPAADNSTMASRAAARRAAEAAPGWTPPPRREFTIDVSEDFNQPSRQVVVTHVDG